MPGDGRSLEHSPQFSFGSRSYFLEIGELVRDFQLFNTVHVNRAADVPAHLCAKNACTLNVTECWLDETPSFVVTSLLADCPRMTIL